MWIQLIRLQLTIASVVAILDYNCNRPNVASCQHGGWCSLSSGLCTGCPASHTGYRCHVPTFAASCAPNVCRNGGTCKTVAGMSTCFCSSGFYGQSCQHSRVTLSCAGGAAPSMTPTLTFETATPFAGRVYVEGHGATAGCVFNALSGNARSLRIPFSSCGRASSESGRDGVTVRSFGVTVRYSALIDSSLDRRVVFGCATTVSGQVVALNSTAFVLSIPSATPSPTTSPTTSQPHDVRLAFHYVASGQPLLASVPSGTLLQLQLHLVAGRGYADVQLTELVARSATAPAALLRLVTEGCADRVAASFSLRLLKRGKTVFYEFKAFKFAAGATVRFDVTATLCTLTCARPTCTNSANHIVGNENLTAVGRRRRRRQTNSIVVRFLSAAIFVVAPENTCCATTVEPPKHPTMADCIRSADVAVLLVALATLVAALSVLTCYLAHKTGHWKGECRRLEFLKQKNGNKQQQQQIHLTKEWKLR